MYCNLLFARRMFAGFLLWLTLALTACSTGPRLVNHSFSFDVLGDSPNVILLDYRYGTSRHGPARRSEVEIQNGVSAQRGGVTGDMILGDDLYLKWRIKATGEVVEKTVDLKSVLPRSIEDTIIYPVIGTTDIDVYLVSRQARPSDFPSVGPGKFRGNKACVLYPISTCGK